MIKKIDICDIPLRSHFVFYDKNPSRYAITCIFQPRFKIVWLPIDYGKILDIFYVIIIIIKLACCVPLCPYKDLKISLFGVPKTSPLRDEWKKF